MTSLKKVHLEPEGQGHGMIMGVTGLSTFPRAILLHSSLLGAIKS
jgi:hypothetical protein